VTLSLFHGRPESGQQLVNLGKDLSDSLARKGQSSLVTVACNPPSVFLPLCQLLIIFFAAKSAASGPTGSFTISHRASLSAPLCQPNGPLVVLSWQHSVLRGGSLESLTFEGALFYSIRSVWHSLFFPVRAHSPSRRNSNGSE